MLDVVHDPLLWRYLSMPVIMAVVGYVTNVAAIWMMFHPVRFVGIRRLGVGWQGVVPRRASVMAGIAVDTIVGPLITRQDLVDNLDPASLASRLAPAAEAAAETIVNEMGARYFRTTWQSLPAAAKAQIRRRARQQAPAVLRDVIVDMQDDIDSLLDLKHLVTHTLIADKRLLNRIFREIGDREFVFIERAGGVFGFLFGLIQILVWSAWQPWWFLPAFGALVGGGTNWLALKMIFNPRQPRSLGPFRVQGVFFRRQAAVASNYGRLVANELLSPEKLAWAVFTGPTAFRFRERVAVRIERAFDDSLGAMQPVAWWVLGPQRRALVSEASTRSLACAQSTVAEYREDLTQRVGLAGLLADRLRSLAPAEFERMLRPAFEQDEWLLILAGAALGATAGVFQLLTLFTGVILRVV